MKIGDKHSCENGCKQFTVDEFFLCPKCLQVVPISLSDILNNIKPIVWRILARIQTRSTKIENENPQKDYERTLYNILKTLLIQMINNLTLQQESMDSEEIYESSDNETKEIKYCKEFFQKMHDKTGIGFPLTIKSLNSYLHNYEAYMTKSFHGECIFQFDSYFRSLNNDFKIAKDKNNKLEKRTSVILKETMRKIEKNFDPLKSPILALAEIRNTYHSNSIPDKDNNFKICCYNFKLEEGKEHHYITLFHVLYLLEKSIQILEYIMDSKDKF